MISIKEFCDLHDACGDGREWALKNCSDMADAWQKLKPDWLLWVATRKGVLSDKELRLFAVFCARQVEHLLTDQRSRDAIETAERYANGESTDAELAAAWAAARDAARAAARAAARDASWAAAAAAAWCASRAAARDASWAAARDAARAAARAAARDAAEGAAEAAAAAAAWCASRAAARDASWAAARDAARAAARDAARDAAEGAAEAAQSDWLRENTKPNFEVTE